MIVTSGFTILLVSVNVAQGDHGLDVGTETECEIREICLGLLGDQRIVRPPFVILLCNSFLWGEIVEDAMSAFPCYSVTLIVDLESPRTVLLAQKVPAISLGQITKVRLPVDVEMAPSLVHVGILEVTVRT